MKARQPDLKSDLFGDDLPKIMPLLQEQNSDSAIFDNCLEFLNLAGRSLPHAAMMMVPEPWENNENMGDSLRAFYEYHSTLMEPWDGPGRDGLHQRCPGRRDPRPQRPASLHVILSPLTDWLFCHPKPAYSRLNPSASCAANRLRPGRMLLIDTEAGRIINDDELKAEMAAAKPYQTWLDQNMIDLDDLEASNKPAAPAGQMNLEQQEKAFGYTYEDVSTIILPMATDAIEPMGAMGNDAPLAVLSDQPQLLYNYFKQLFAQVTNPPIDANFEALVTTTDTYIGSDGSLTDPQPGNCRQIRIHYPLITNDELLKLRDVSREGFASATLPILYPTGGNGEQLKAALEQLFAQADAAIESGKNILILSDRGISETEAAMPALLAVAGLHHHLIRRQTRTRVSLVLESGEPREVHHFALLVGYGASAINPYLAFDVISDAIVTGRLTCISPEKALANYHQGGHVKGVRQESFPRWGSQRSRATRERRSSRPWVIGQRIGRPLLHLDHAFARGGNRLNLLTSRKPWFPATTKLLSGAA